MQVTALPVGSATLVADVTGEGPCVVFLHAGVADRRMWRSSCASLKPQFRCIAWDRRGFGESIAYDEAYRSIEDLDLIIQHFGCPGVHLIGSSQGGGIAIDYTLANPKKVKSLILVAPSITGVAAPAQYPDAIRQLIGELEYAEATRDIERINAIEAHMWLDGPLNQEGRISGPVRELFLDMNGRALKHMQLTEERANPSAVEHLSSITLPTLVIWGDADFPHIQQWSSLIAETVRDGQHLVMQGCSHLPNLEQPGKFNAAVLEFLTGLL
jgi:pimeloyl-ACP methyl ester carboxylesterase